MSRETRFGKYKKENRYYDMIKHTKGDKKKELDARRLGLKIEPEHNEPKENK